MKKYIFNVHKRGDNYWLQKIRIKDAVIIEERLIIDGATN